jgi:uncharacterized membrane protein
MMDAGTNNPSQNAVKGKIYVYFLNRILIGQLTVQQLYLNVATFCMVNTSTLSCEGQRFQIAS